MRRAAILVTCLLALLLAPPSTGAGEETGNSVGPERVREILEEYLAVQRPLLPPAEVRLRSLQLPPPFTLPAGRLSWRVIPSDPRLLGSRSFTLLFHVDGRLARNLTVRGELEALAPVVVAAVDLSRGCELTARDLSLVPLDLGGVRNPCFAVAELVGKRLKRPVRGGEPLDRAAVEFPPLVRRGEMVTLRARRGALLLTALGEARQDGEAGETIRVRNSSSRQEVLARVVAAGVAEVEF